MTDEEKIKRYDTFEILRKQIGSSYGCEDGIFAGHQNDEDRAKKFRKLAFENGITLDEILDINIAYLYRKGYILEHIQKQMVKVEKFYSKKLS